MQKLSGFRISPLGKQVEVAVGVRDGGLEDIPSLARFAERAAAIRFQGPLKGLQVPQEALGFGPSPAQEFAPTLEE